MTSAVTKTKYPIICAPMNGVSDVKLALACMNAGILPSLVLYNYIVNGKVDLNLFEEALSELRLSTSGPLMLACESTDLDFLTDILIKYGVSFVEILDCEKHNAKKIYNQYITFKNRGITIYPKLIAGYSSVKKLMDNVGKFSHVLIKSPNGAGCSVEGVDLETDIINIKKSYPDLNLIVSGGVTNSSDIKRLLDLGADAVALGTLFCVSEESSIPIHTKQKIIDSSYKDIKRLDTGYQQKALIFSKVTETDINNTVGLFKGIKTGNEGHIYIGSGIDSIEKIEPINDIVMRLVQDL